jgi:hypothetical protein
MKRRLWIMLVLSLSLVLLLTACGESGGNESGGSGGNESGSPSNGESGGEGEGGSGGEGASGELDTSIAIGTHATGSGYHKVGAGFAKIISDYSEIAANVRPMAGPQAWMPELKGGVLEFGLMASPDVVLARTGGPGYDEPVENLRLVFGGMPMYNTGYGVRADSDIKSLKDLKGKRVATEFGGNYLMGQQSRAALASVGLSYDDVVQVPVPEFMASLDALQDGNVDAAYPASPDAAKAIEVANAVGGIRVLPFGDLKPEDIANGVPEEMQAILDKYTPATSLAVVPAGTGILEEDTVMLYYYMTMVTSADVSEETVYQVLKAIWEHTEEMHNVSSYTAELSPEMMLVEFPPAPYHDGAKKFYQEMGVWNENHEKLVDEK